MAWTFQEKSSFLSSFLFFLFFYWQSFPCLTLRILLGRSIISGGWLWAGERLPRKEEKRKERKENGLARTRDLKACSKGKKSEKNQDFSHRKKGQKEGRATGAGAGSLRTYQLQKWAREEKRNEKKEDVLEVFWIFWIFFFFFCPTPSFFLKKKPRLELQQQFWRWVHSLFLLPLPPLPGSSSWNRALSWPFWSSKSCRCWEGKKGENEWVNN